MGAVTLRDIPLDAWVVIMMHVERSNLVCVFDRIFASGALSVPLRSRLDTFWVVISQARIVS
jgi:hypothetical protein